MLSAVVLSMQQQHREELGGFDARRHQPVSQIMGDAWDQPPKVPYNQLSATQNWTIHWKTKLYTEAALIDSILVWRKTKEEVYGGSKRRHEGS